MLGGHTPRIAGRPAGIVHTVPVPRTLEIVLHRAGINYRPVVNEGDEVVPGLPLAQADVAGGTLSLPAPAAGRVATVPAESDTAGRIVLETTTATDPETRYQTYKPQRVDAAKIRKALATHGIWPFFWSSSTNGTPPLGDGEQPRAVIVNCVLTEPFRTRGKVVLRRSWNDIVQGLKFLPRLLKDYGTVEIVLTHKQDPVSRMLYAELAGHAWVRFYPVPLVYPVEHPGVLNAALRRSDSSLGREDVVWVVDVQAVEAVGACLGSGTTLSERTVAVGGPGCSEPRHFCAKIGTPLSEMVEDDVTGGLVLRGGILTGKPVDFESCVVEYDDDAFFFLPKASGREFLSFVRAGFTRTSVFPAFASALTGAYDSHVSTALRGEKRPCIACAQCEDVCPAGLLPQVLHRYLYRDALDEAEALGLARCIDCGLCTYVCPSKISLAEEFKEAEEELRREREEALAAEQKESDT